MDIIEKMKTGEIPNYSDAILFKRSFILDESFRFKFSVPEITKQVDEMNILDPAIRLKLLSVYTWNHYYDLYFNE